MVIALICVSILLFFSIICNVLLFFISSRFQMILNEIAELEEERAFLAGEIDLPEDRVLQKFPNATIIYHVETFPGDAEDPIKVLDTSSYMKNHIIGLTYFVPEQVLKEVNDSLYNSQELRKRIRDRLAQDADNLEPEALNLLIEETIKEIRQESDLDLDSSIPHCTVYLLKDGGWIWRQESF